MESILRIPLIYEGHGPLRWEEEISNEEEKLALKAKFAACLSLTVALAVSAVALAQSALSTRDGVYTDAQAEQGHALYTRQCSMCHGAKLQGMGQNPALTGQGFLQNWTGQTLADLYTQLHATMPATKPGSLQPDEVAQLIAYILSANHYPAGKTELPQTSDQLKAIHFDSPASASK